MPKEQYMCQLCANHGVFNQPKKGHKQKCPHRDCPCELCALNTKRRALDQIERQLKSSSIPSVSSSDSIPLEASKEEKDDLDSPMASSSSSSTPKPSQEPSISSPSEMTPLLNPFSSLFTPPFFHPFFPPSSSSSFMLPPSIGSMFLPSVFIPPSSSSSPSSSSVSPTSNSSKLPGGGPTPTTRNPHHSSSSPYAVALPATITRKGMREALKNRSLTAAIENIRVKNETQTESSEAERRKSIFHSVEQLAG
ncbi:mab-23 [Pristionchus pacificus]|uniref:DM domain-containing protein n=1 Tax=Pristionchus pacificus TaxID=54126 RepID=A0A2A6CSK9_PRIPA|nr:mab-23 [Pristionchus pacificus]|eukprot:PDM81204.1 hypothetical protein PRIPAC_36207 [Pristionchus pacificus]